MDKPIYYTETGESVDNIETGESVDNIEIGESVDNIVLDLWIEIIPHQ